MGLDDEKGKLRRRIERAKKEIEKKLVLYLGGSKAVEVQIKNNRGVRYNFTCPVQDCFFEEKQLSRHFRSKYHGWSESKASLTESFRVRYFNYLTKVEKNKVRVIFFIFTIGL